MTDRKRDPLPEGYKFGDAGDPFTRMSDEQKAAYCREHYVEPAMKELRRRALAGTTDESDRQMMQFLGWNVIEADHFTDYRDQHAVAVAQSFVKNNPTANRPAVLFRLGVDTCPTCGTTGKYDCPDCGCWVPPFDTGRDHGDEA